MKSDSNLIMPFAIFFASIIAAYILGNAIMRFKNEDRYIAVKGFSEKEVKADLVIWTIKIKMADNDLVKGNADLAQAKAKVINFLTNKGIKTNEITSKDIMVIDNEANENFGNHVIRVRYIIEETVEVRSNNVDLVQGISRMTSELLNAGVALSTKNDWQGSGLRYIFTKLSDIKPTMIVEAINNAEKAATEFAKESNTSLGKLRRASQGLFSIQDRDESLAGGGEGGGYDNGTSQLFKKVRVVISADYSLD
jgi:hypothetical protein